MKKFIASFKYAFSGIIHAFGHERNMKIHILGLLFFIVSGFYFKFTYIEWCLGILASTMVLTSELFNTALEAWIDKTSPEIHPLAKIAKDCAAGAVLISAIAALAIWLLIVSHRV